MSLIVENRTSMSFISISDPSHKIPTVIRLLKDIPQQVQNLSPQAKIDVVEEPYYYTVCCSELSGVVLRDLWVHIKGRTLTISAGITGKKQKKGGKYRYTKKILGGIKGKITLPGKLHQEPRIAEFGDGVLLLIFPKATDEFSKRLAFESRNEMRIRF
jgi:HSP20 family molecular chaperone IbpA